MKKYQFFIPVLLGILIVLIVLKSPSIPAISYFFSEYRGMDKYVNEYRQTKLYGYIVAEIPFVTAANYQQKIKTLEAFKLTDPREIALRTDLLGDLYFRFKNYTKAEKFYDQLEKMNVKYYFYPPINYEEHRLEMGDLVYASTPEGIHQKIILSEIKGDKKKIIELSQVLLKKYKKVIYGYYASDIAHFYGETAEGYLKKYFSPQ